MRPNNNNDDDRNPRTQPPFHSPILCDLIKIYFSRHCIPIRPSSVISTTAK